MKQVALALATWFGCGYFPWGPGTAGSVAAVGIVALLHFYFEAGRVAISILFLALLAPAIWASSETERVVRQKDPGIVVIDEVLGQWLTLLGAVALSWKSLAAGFLLFRIFDIWKPWPVRWFEKLPEGAGIVADDLAAGVYGALILYIGGAFRIY